MFHSLRIRFALSHTLPILLLVPLLSLTLLYLLQTRYFLEALSEELVVQAQMLAATVGQDPDFWQDSTGAQEYLTKVSAEMTARVMFLDGDGRVYVTTPSSGVSIGSEIHLDVTDEALGGATTWRARYSVNMHDDVVDVAVPVADETGSVVGVVRLSQSLASVQDRLRMLTWYIVVVFSFGILAALALALFLARTVGIPLLRLGNAVLTVPGQDAPMPVTVTGPAELRQLADAFNRMAASLANQRRLRRRILAGIVHEMSRPLGGINAAAQYLMRNGETAPPALVVELSEEIVEQVGQMTRQIDDLALLAQALNQQIELHPEMISLADLCRKEIRHVQTAADKKSLKVGLEVVPATPQIYADPRRVKQIIGNLLSNAVKFSPTGGTIEMNVYPVVKNTEDPAVELSVRDTGLGIAPAEQPLIFEYFFRGPEQRPLQSGMGLGLAISAQLAAAQGGELRVSSQPDQGATFFLRLPQHPPVTGVWASTQSDP
jgi:signal transduction histidine kinase